jgi:curli biogenesis system outer membrane secretion channel CsgG
MTYRALRLGAAMALLASTSALAQTHVSERDLSSLLVHCDAPVASVSIGAFNCKATGCQRDQSTSAGQAAGFAAILQMAQAAQGISTASFPGLGDTMSSAMVTALKGTGCVTVQEREAMADLAREAELSGIKLSITPADYLISGSITSVAVSSKSNTFGGGVLPVVGALNHSTKTANLGVDVRVIDVKGSSVRDSRTFEADSTRAKWGVGGAGFGGGAGLFGIATSTQSAELDSVANEVVITAANFIAETVAGAAITRRPALPAPKR